MQRTSHRVIKVCECQLGILRGSLPSQLLYLQTLHHKVLSSELGRDDVSVYKHVSKDFAGQVIELKACLAM